MHGLLICKYATDGHCVQVSARNVDALKTPLVIGKEEEIKRFDYFLLFFCLKVTQTLIVFLGAVVSEKLHAASLTWQNTSHFNLSFLWPVSNIQHRFLSLLPRQPNQKLPCKI